MANKNQIETLINQNLADFSDIVPSEHRAIEHALLGEMFPNLIVDTEGTEEVLSPSQSSNIGYEISVYKVGGVVYMQGLIQNKQPLNFGGQSVAEIIDANHEIKTGYSFIFNCNTQDRRIFSDGNTLYINMLLPYEQVKFNINYKTNL